VQSDCDAAAAEDEHYDDVIADATQLGDAEVFDCSEVRSVSPDTHIIINGDTSGTCVIKKRMMIFYRATLC